MAFLESLHPNLLLLSVALLGLVTGSFLNVVILRFPKRLLHEWRGQCRDLLAIEPSAEAAPPGLVFERSRCPKCGNAISWYDNIPILSWLVLRARCRHCNTGISIRYPSVELLTALTSVAVVAVLGATPAGLAGLVFTWVLIAGAGIDLDHKLLPDQFTLPLLWLGLALNAFGVFTDLHSAVWGAIGGYGILWLVFHLFRLLTGKEGMGYGDFKLLGAIGAWLGWQLLPLVILLASLVGALVGIALIAARRMGREVPIAFGPFLAAAGWIAMLWGPNLTRAWFGF